MPKDRRFKPTPFDSRFQPGTVVVIPTVPAVNIVDKDVGQPRVVARASTGGGVSGMSVAGGGITAKNLRTPPGIAALAAGPARIAGKAITEGI